MNSSCWNNVKITILSALLLLAMAPRVMAQSQNISGTVLDASGGIIPDATITIVDAAKGGTVREVKTNELGRFLAIDIQPGQYVISIEKNGFKKADVQLT